jgi:hypothetical protein
MTIVETERPRSRRKHHKQTKHKRPKQQKYALDAPLSIAHANQILTFFEWCQLNRFSERTGRRLLQRGEGPVVTQLSPQRIGISIENNARWQASRARGAARPSPSL